MIKITSFRTQWNSVIGFIVAVISLVYLYFEYIKSQSWWMERLDSIQFLHSFHRSLKKSIFYTYINCYAILTITSPGKKSQTCHEIQLQNRSIQKYSQMVLRPDPHLIVFTPLHSKWNLLSSYKELKRQDSAREDSSTQS